MRRPLIRLRPAPLPDQASAIPMFSAQGKGKAEGTVVSMVGRVR